MRTATRAPEIAKTKIPRRSRTTRVLTAHRPSVAATPAIQSCSCLHPHPRRRVRATPRRRWTPRSAGRRSRWRRLAPPRESGVTTRSSVRSAGRWTDVVHLTLAGTSEDGKRLLLVSDTGEEFTLDVDSRLRSALRGDTSRLGQLEIPMDSVLRPRDIQARIRAGETPEAVAEAARTTVEKIMPFAGPVLAERAHVAERAQRSSIRRRSGDGARILGEAVETHLRSVNVGADSVTWDAWRREDGRWVLTAAYAAQARTGTATFTFDMRGNYAVAEDDDARWLVGDQIATPPAPPTQDDLEQVRRRRAAAVDEGAEELPLGDDAIHLVSPAPVEAYLEPPAAESPTAESPAAESPTAEIPAVAPTEAPAPVAEPGQPEPPAAAADEEHHDAPPARRPARKGRGRASVPSWDEIMFGSKD
ncbi:MAG: DUF3071 domain-containing protein [Actinobacteria bacterium]|nr:DUF3071 domain-containing protein [Actinomycetota bacterium]